MIKKNNYPGICKSFVNGIPFLLPATAGFQSAAVSYLWFARFSLREAGFLFEISSPGLSNRKSPGFIIFTG